MISGPKPIYSTGKRPASDSSSSLLDPVSPSTNPHESSFKKPDLIPFYDEFARIRNLPFRSSGSSHEVFPLALFKALLYKLWKDVRKGDQEAILEDMNRWIRTVWTHGDINLIAAQRSSLEFELHMKETAVWKGRLMDLEFHLELHLEQTWIQLPAKVSTNKLKFLAPNLVDTGRFQISWCHPFSLEIFDKELRQRLLMAN